MDPFELSIYKHYFELAKFPSLESPTQNISLDFLLGRYDAFFFDAFGTLYNHKHYIYPGAQEMFQRIREKGKSLRLITNAASQPIPQLMEDLHSMGFHFQRDEIFSSGELLVFLNQRLKITEAFYSGYPAGISFLNAAGICVQENPKENVVIVSAAIEEPVIYSKALEILKRPGGHLIVLNPDAWAPRIGGPRVPVSGAYAHRLKLESDCTASYCGKPFPELFLRALKNLPQGTKAVMIGDTLATDIAGALNVGIDAALIVGRNMEENSLAEDETALHVRPTYYLGPL
jgi:HAD superfamily hydrolase (TIGR01450 family)